MDWGCLPDFDSPAIFCRLLDAEHGGYFQIAPTDGTIPGLQHYLPGSNVLQTRFASIAGEVLLTDFMPVETLSALPFQEMNDTTRTGGEDPSYCLVRIVECTRGELPITMTLKATPQYAAASSAAHLVSENTGAVISGGEQHLGLAIAGTHQFPSFALTVEQSIEAITPIVIAQATLHQGERLVFAAGVTRTAQAARTLAQYPPRQCDFEAALAHTLRCWQTWVTRCTYRGPYAALVQRSALVLKMMTYAPTGAIVAARPLLSLKSWGWYVTGITATPGYAMPPLRSMHSARLDIMRRLMRSLIGCVVSLTRAAMTSRSCTVSEVSATWASGSCHISAAIKLQEIEFSVHGGME